MTHFAWFGDYLAQYTNASTTKSGDRVWLSGRLTRLHKKKACKIISQALNLLVGRVRFERTTIALKVAFLN